MVCTRQHSVARAILSIGGIIPVTVARQERPDSYTKGHRFESGRRLPLNLTSKQALITFVGSLRRSPRKLTTKGPQQVTDFTSSSWAEALREFLLNMEATRAPKTHRNYKVQLAQLIGWADANNVCFSEFGKRDLDRFLVERAKSGKSQLTLHHDAICA